MDTTTGTCTNDVSDVSGTVSEGQQCISFTRPFNPGEILIASFLLEIRPVLKGACNLPIIIYY